MVDLWDVATGSRRARCEGHKGPVYQRRVRPRRTGGRIGGYRRIPRIWNARNGQAARRAAEAGRLDLLDRLRPDGKTVATGNQMAVR